MSAQLDEARRIASSLLDALESGASTGEGNLMKAKRLARLMRDTDAQTWLDLETSGYPSGFSFRTLGTCEKYARSSGRINSETQKYYLQSLPEFEAMTVADEATLRSFERVGGQSTVVENYVVKRASEEFIAGQIKLQQDYKAIFNRHKAISASLRAAIHSYATDTYLAIELGDVAQTIFEAARNDVDTFVRAHCPKAAEQLIAINERMADQSTESRTAALTTCRRLLMTVADSLFAPRNEDWIDGNGKVRKVGPEQYKNRLLAYLSQATARDSSQEVVVSGLEHLAARLDAIYEKTCKGVHVDVSEQEARLAVILGEIGNASGTSA